MLYLLFIVNFFLLTFKMAHYMIKRSKILNSKLSVNVLLYLIKKKKSNIRYKRPAPSSIILIFILIYVKIVYEEVIMSRRFHAIILLFFLFISPSIIFCVEYKSIHQLDWERLKEKSGLVPSEKTGFTRTTPCVNKEVVGFYNSYSSNYLSQIQWDLLTIVAWFSVTANADGSLTNSSGWHWPEYAPISTAHSNGVKVVLTVTCFNSTTIGTILGSSSIRATLINNLLTLVQNGNGDGVCIDFEGVPSGYKTQLVTFMTELNNTFKTTNPDYHVSICTPAVDWSGVFDYDELALNSDALFIMAYDYHWSSGSKAGPVAPLTSGSVWGTYNVTWTVGDYIKWGLYPEKFILGVPYYGYKWPTDSGNLNANTTGTGTAVIFRNAKTQSQTYGRLWDTNSQTPWYKYQDPGWFQCWYDDAESLILKYDLAISSSLGGVGMWALGYDGMENDLWDVLRSKFCDDQTPPDTPILSITRYIGNNRIEVIWEEVPDPNLSEYRVFRSIDAINYSLNSTYPPGTHSCIDNISGTETVYYYKVYAVDTNNNISGPSDVYGVKVSENQDRFLIIEDDNRFENDDFSKYYTEACRNLPYAFDNAGSEAVVNGTVVLNGYFGVIWFCGRDSFYPTHGTGTINAAEQPFISTYLEAGGKVFFSGAEIGYDLDYKGTNPAFYNNYLKADYLQDDSGNYRLLGSGIFSGMDFYFDDDDNIPDGGAYEPRWPDVITTYGGSSVCISYGTGTTAGIQFSGIFGAGTETGKVITFGFPFETIIDPEQRKEVLKRILLWFDDQPPDLSELDSITNDGTGKVNLTWKPGIKEDISEIELELSSDGINFSPHSTFSASPNSCQVSGLTPDNNYYFRIRSIDLAGNRGPVSGVLALRLSSVKKPDLLIIEDENRYAPNDYIIPYALALYNDLHYFDSASSESVVSGTVDLHDYDKVVWFCGRDSYYPDYGTGTFNTSEAELVKSYLNFGGKIFITGAEIGYDLEYKGSNIDLFQNYFKSDYLYDDGIGYTVTGIAGEIFTGLTIEIYTDDSGSVQGSASYQTKWPDSITGINGGITILRYSSGRDAGCRWAGFSPE
ncbi:MAG TPA: hypothetical protein ENN73_03450, partial [Firmicutes bacterium]|nr:hypothetical protein [Bacillota bacterium]